MQSQRDGFAQDLEAISCVGAWSLLFECCYCTCTGMVVVIGPLVWEASLCSKDFQGWDLFMYICIYVFWGQCMSLLKPTPRGQHLASLVARRRNLTGHVAAPREERRKRSNISPLLLSCSYSSFFFFFPLTLHHFWQNGLGEAFFLDRDFVIPWCHF